MGGGFDMLQNILSISILVLLLVLLAFLIVIFTKMKKNENKEDGSSMLDYMDKVNKKNQESIDSIRTLMNENHEKQTLMNQNQYEKLSKENQDYRNKSMESDASFRDALNQKIQTQMNAIQEERNEYQMTSQKEMAQFKTDIQSKLEDFTKQSKQDISDSYTKLLELVTNQLNEMKKNVSDSLKTGFDNNSKTMGDVNVALGKITAAQTNLDSLKEQVVSLNNVLTNTQRRGRFGEVALGALLDEVYGSTHDLYSLQFVLKNGKRPDAVIRLPDGKRHICIDSKFSLDAYWRLVESKDDVEIDKCKKNFRNALREQAKKIKDDYIGKEDTTDYAIMFLPSDGIYSYIQADDDLFNSVVSYARGMNVIITSPSTLQPILANIRMLQVNYEVSRNIKEILKAVDKVRKQNDYFSRDWEAVSKSISALNNKKESFDKRVTMLHDETDKLLTQAKDNGLLEDTKEESKNETDSADQGL